MNVHGTLAMIQQKLKAPKNQRNNFGKYNYRSCEDILEAVKPLLGNATLTLSDEIIEVGGRVYVKVTATLTLDGESVSTTAMAREAVSRKGTDDSQLTGATSSYARKYALGGLLLIDDNKDADAGNVSPEYTQPEPLTKDQVANITAIAQEKGVDISAICMAYKVLNLGDIASASYDNIIERLEQK